MLDRQLVMVAGLAVVVAGCVTSKPVGSNPDDGMNDDGVDDGVDDMDGTADAGDDGVDNGVDDGVDDGAEMCPDNLGTCTALRCEDGTCTGPLSEFDADGCLRARCGQTPCPDGRTCVELEPWGACAPSTNICEIDAGTCSCEVTADCMPTSVCVPDEEAPPPVETCIAADPGAGFSFNPSIGEVQGAATCTVDSVDPIQLDCAGDFTGVYTLDLYTSGQVDLTQGEEVTVNYWFESEIEWANEWLRITRDGLPAEPIVAVSADTLLPPGVAAADFWPTNVDIGRTYFGCPVATCPDTGMPYVGHAIETLNGEGAVFAAGEGGFVPGKFGGGSVIIQVREARDGACGASLGDQEAWNAFTLIQQG